MPWCARIPEHVIDDCGKLVGCHSQHEHQHFQWVQLCICPKVAQLPHLIHTLKVEHSIRTYAYYVSHAHKQRMISIRWLQPMQPGHLCSLHNSGIGRIVELCLAHSLCHAVVTEPSCSWHMQCVTLGKVDLVTCIAFGTIMPPSADPLMRQPCMRTVAGCSICT